MNRAAAVVVRTGWWRWERFAAVPLHPVRSCTSTANNNNNNNNAPLSASVTPGEWLTSAAARPLGAVEWQAPLHLESGRWARLTAGSLTVQSGGTLVLVACALARQRAPTSFAALDALAGTATGGRSDPGSGVALVAPLRTEYRERASARGLIPTSYHRREAAATEKEVLTARLMDRALRPALAPGYVVETHVAAHVLSADGEHDPDVLAVNGASVALALAWANTTPEAVSAAPTSLAAAVRVARRPDTGAWILQPTHEQRKRSDIELVYVGNARGECLALEGAARPVSPAELAMAARVGAAGVLPILEAQQRLVQQARERSTSSSSSSSSSSSLFLAQPRPALVAAAAEHSFAALREVYARGAAQSKTQRGAAIAQQTAVAMQHLRRQHPEAGVTETSLALLEVSRRAWRDLLHTERRRVDGRRVDEARPLEARVAVLPLGGCHGSAVCTRGETQVLAVATLGLPALAKPLDAYGGGDESKSFYVHYDFPAYCVGEVAAGGEWAGRSRRREVGHGALAERALRALIPPDMPQAVRVNAEVLASAGSTSMAAVAAGSLALMDAGVQLSGPASGVSIGGVRLADDASSSSASSSSLLLLTDLIGLEDFLGEFDFKVAGTAAGITAWHLDVKRSGLKLAEVERALERAAAVHAVHVEEVLRPALPEGRARLQPPPQAPCIARLAMPSAARARVLGVGGQCVRSIEARTGCRVQVDDEDVVHVWAPNRPACMEAQRLVERAMRPPQPGDRLRGRVLQVLEHGAVVEVRTHASAPRQQGLLHRSAFATADGWARTHVGDSVAVRVAQVDARTGALRFIEQQLERLSKASEGGDEEEEVEAAKTPDKPAAWRTSQQAHS
ncbi:hypothetical protein CDCA_CDCA05G1574 [Cyanidium caldarium]|uniref:polyribonucleotide nucleotidyltransferase n=1 Tax=Cyanidium caldarium TaxID=2771 RepID=A0AAV9ITS0_CYACA|nr:hypothetical protein CDCA_CDCA05G1574 [Cyanidium caldarium]